MANEMANDSTPSLAIVRSTHLGQSCPFRLASKASHFLHEAPDACLCGPMCGRLPVWIRKKQTVQTARPTGCGCLPTYSSAPWSDWPPAGQSGERYSDEGRTIPVPRRGLPRQGRLERSLIRGREMLGFRTSRVRAIICQPCGASSDQRLTNWTGARRAPVQTSRLAIQLSPHRVLRCRRIATPTSSPRLHRASQDQSRYSSTRSASIRTVNFNLGWDFADAFPGGRPGRA